MPNTNIQVEYLPSFIEIKCVRWLTCNFKEKKWNFSNLPKIFTLRHNLKQFQLFFGLFFSYPYHSTLRKINYLNCWTVSAVCTVLCYVAFFWFNWRGNFIFITRPTRSHKHSLSSWSIRIGHAFQRFDIWFYFRICSVSLVKSMNIIYLFIYL